MIIFCYIDPGTGSLTMQVISSGLLLSLLALKAVWQSVQNNLPKIVLTKSCTLIRLPKVLTRFRVFTKSILFAKLKP
jgi:hypothetical protein